MPDFTVKHVYISLQLLQHEAPFSGKAFSVHSNLTAHIPTHTGVKQFKCTKCEKSFVHASSLHKHMKTHSAPKQGNWNDIDITICCYLFLCIHVVANMSKRTLWLAWLVLHSNTGCVHPFAGEYPAYRRLRTLYWRWHDTIVQVGNVWQASTPVGYNRCPHVSLTCSCHVM